jgi:tetratricopeptide (TPR) repeat protein
VLVLCLASCSEDPTIAKQRFLESGDRYLASANYPAAVVEYRNAAQLDSRAGDVRLKLGEAHLRSGEFPAALREYVRAADLLPQDVQAQLKAGQLLLVAGRFEDAKARAERALAIDARHVDAQLLKANALAGLKDIDSAIAEIEDAVRSNPDRGDSYASIGAFELGRGNREAAEAAFKEAVALQPDSLRANLALANFYWGTAQWSAADRFIKRAIEIAPDDVLANRAWANFLIATNRWAEAELPLRKIVQRTKAAVDVLALADYYVGTRNLDAATRALQSATSDPELSNEVNVRLAIVDYRSGRQAEAYQRLDTVLMRSEGHLKALLVKARLLLNDRELDRALTSAKKAAELYPQSTEALLLLGQISSRANQVDAAITAYQDVLKRNPRITDAHTALARLYLAKGRVDDSLRAAQEALDAEGGRADAQLLLVRGLIRQGNIPRAESTMKELAARFPDSPGVLAQLGMIAGNKGDLVTARARFERALKLRPGHAEALSGVVALDVAGGRFPEARKRLEAAVAQNPSSQVHLMLAGRTYSMIGEHLRAEESFKKVLQLNPEHLDAYELLATAYWHQGRIDAAIANFEEIVRRQPQSVIAHTMIGILLEAQNRPLQAAKRYETALQLDPTAAVPANNLAWIYAQRGEDLKRALDLAKAAQLKWPDDPRVNHTLGWVYVKNQMPALAVPALQKSVAAAPDNPTYHYHLGVAYRDAGYLAQARKALELALKLGTDFAGVDDARRILKQIS